MAKLAASRKANSSAVAPPALSAGGPAKQYVASQQTAVKEDGKKSMIPEDIKRKLLAKVRLVSIKAPFELTEQHQGEATWC